MATCPLMRRLLITLQPLLPRRRATRKLGCCACTAVDCFCLNLFTLCFFSFCCFLPRMLGATVKVRAALQCSLLCPVDWPEACFMGMQAAVHRAAARCTQRARHVAPPSPRLTCNRFEAGFPPPVAAHVFYLPFCALQGTFSMSSALALVLGFILAVACYILLVTVSSVSV